MLLYSNDSDIVDEVSQVRPLYLLPAIDITSLPVLYLVCILVQLTLSMAYTIKFTVMMDKSQIATAGTDYTLQTSFLTLSSILAGGISGVIAEALGYIPLFLLSIVIGLTSVMFINKTF